MNPQTNSRPLYEVLTEYFYQTNRLYHDAAKSLGLSDAEFAVFYLLDTLGSSSFSQLAASTGLPKQTLHSCVKKLLDRGLLETSGASTTRNRLYFPSEKGAGIIRPLIGRVKEAEMRAAGIFTPEEQEDFSRKVILYLHSLSQSLKALEREEALAARSKKEDASGRAESSPAGEAVRERRDFE